MNTISILNRIHVMIGMVSRIGLPISLFGWFSPLTVATIIMIWVAAVVSRGITGMAAIKSKKYREALTKNISKGSNLELMAHRRHIRSKQKISNGFCIAEGCMVVALHFMNPAMFTFATGFFIIIAVIIAVSVSNGISDAALNLGFDAATNTMNARNDNNLKELR